MELTDTQFFWYIRKTWISAAWVVAFRQFVAVSNTECDNKGRPLSSQSNHHERGDK